MTSELSPSRDYRGAHTIKIKLAITKLKQGASKPVKHFENENERRNGGRNSDIISTNNVFP